MHQEFDSDEPISEVAIMIRAHEKWVFAGKPNGDGGIFWSEAERELRQEAEQRRSLLQQNHCERSWKTTIGSSTPL